MHNKSTFLINFSQRLCFQHRGIRFNNLNFIIIFLCIVVFWFSDHFICQFYATSNICIWWMYLNLDGNWFMLHCLFDLFTGALWKASRSLYMLAWSNRSIWFSQVCWCWIQTRFQGDFPWWSSLSSEGKFWFVTMMPRIVIVNQFFFFLGLCWDLEEAYMLGVALFLHETKYH